MPQRLKKLPIQCGLNNLNFIKMKTILYSIIAIISFGIIAAGFTNKTPGQKKLLLQSVENTISPASLNQSAKIITGRLKDFGAGDFVVTIIREKNQISVSIPVTPDINVVEKLISQKGEILFCETYNH